MNNLNIARAGLIGSYLAVVLILLIDTLASGGEHTQDTAWFTPYLIWLFKCIPLLMVLPGLISGGERASSWIGYLSMLYFIFAVLLFFTPGAELRGGLLTLSTMALFIFSTLYTRWKKAADAASAE